MEGIVHPIMYRVRTTLRAWHEQRANAFETKSTAAGHRAEQGSAPAFAAQVYSNPVMHRLLVVVYQLCKTRGYKHVIKLFPHEVADVEPCVQALVCQDPAAHESWEMRYILLLWLSILVLIPFDLTTVDSSAGYGGHSSTSGGIVGSILLLCRSYLSDPGAVRDGSAVCIARLLTRPDMDKSHLRSYLAWASDSLAACTSKQQNAADDLDADADVDPASGSGSNAADGSGGSDPLDGPAAGSSVDGAGAPSGGDASSAASTNPASAAQSVASRIFLATGILQSLVNIAKFGHRDTLIDVLADTFSRVSAIAVNDTNAGRGVSGGKSGGLKASPLLRKLTVKLAARTGLTYLPPRVVAWRYQRGSRSLLENLSMAGVAGAAPGVSDITNSVGSSDLLQSVNAGLRDMTRSSSAGGAGAASADAEEEVIDVPSEMEDIIDLLLQGLRDTDTVVRWSSAKGIGRVTGRLPQDFADDVVAAVSQLLSPQEGDGAWHGGCLALAELARRGLLVPSRLPEVVPLVLQALQYDIRRGSHSVGQHVRDAACYVCWAFARAYAPTIMRPHVLQLAQGMLITALFDREVNCRRAASAAFQENVGRQGHDNFPNGIAILTEADYFTLGNRVYAYLNVAPKVGQYPQYRHALLSHLLEVKLKHWDKDVRELSARALARLTPLDPAWMINTAIPSLLPLTTSPDLFVRHGATLGIAELVLALAQVPIAARLSSFHLDEIRNIVVKAEKARVYTGRGGEIVRAAMCRLIECQCLAGHALSRKAALRFLQTIDDCLKHPNDMIQAHAVAALRALTTHALKEPEKEVLDKVTRSYVTRMSDENPAVRRGTALALGALPRSLLVGPELDRVVNALCKATQPEKVAYKRDAETRRNAVIGIGELVVSVGFARVQAMTLPQLLGRDEDAAVPALKASAGAGDGLTAAHLAKLWDCLLDASRDYATDNRGDVGSWVRKAALESMERIVVELQAASWRYRALQRALTVLKASGPANDGAAAAAAAEEVHVQLACDPISAAGGAAGRIETLQHTSGYGNITGYGAGIRLLNNPARVDAKVTVNGLQKGRNVQTAYGVGVISAILTGGSMCEVRFEKGGVGAAYFPYGVGIIAASKLKPAPAVTPATAHDSPLALLAARFGASTATASSIVLPVPIEDPATFLTEAMQSSTICAFLRQASEKLDLLRAVAGDALCRMLHLPAPLPQLDSVLHRDLLISVFQQPGWGGSIGIPLLGGSAPAAAGSQSTRNDAAEENFGAEDAGAGDNDDGAAIATEEADGASNAASAAAAAQPAAKPTDALSIQWAIPHQCFPRIVQLLGAAAYVGAVVEGLVTSVGGLSESVVKHSASALSAWAGEARRSGRLPELSLVAHSLLALIQPRPRLSWELDSSASDPAGGRGSGAADGGAGGSFDPSLQRWFKEILGTAAGAGAGGTRSSSKGGASAVISGAGSSAADGSAGASDINVTHKVDVRVIVPALRTLETLLGNGSLDALQPPQHAWASDLLIMVRRRVVMARDDVTRVQAAAAVYLGLLHFEQPVRGESLTSLLDLLCHPFPRVRKSTAERLYVRLLTMDDILSAG